MSETEREFEVVLWGATGFTGRLVAEYLAERYGSSDLDWAIAGRNQKKLRRLREDLAEIDPTLESLPIRTGDALEPASLQAIAAQTEVVCSTVGPYAVYGSNLVAACADHGTNYCDLTGEIHWMREMIDTYDDDARLHGARIVHSCGFDSIPSDLGTLMVQEYAREHYGVSCSRVGMFVRDVSGGGLSGGTLASMASGFDSAGEDERVRRMLAHPYALNPRGEREGPDEGTQHGVRYDEDLGGWTAPFLMAAVNEKVVRRSNALLGYRWGREFSYREAVATGSGPSGAIRAGAVAAGTGAFVGALATGPIRALLQKTVLAEPGEGPSREEIEQGSFEIRLIGRGTDPEGESFALEGTVAADRDPGYGATAIMLGESALALARSDSGTPLNAGILTPASGIGMPLVERLRRAGMTFSVEARE